MPLAVGSTLAHYKILAPLGSGAMGEVYRASDARLGREVAIKVLPAHFAADEERLRRFEREARSIAALNHPNVAQIHGFDRIGDTCFLVLELVPGETLEERIARGPLPVDEALDVGRQIAEGLEAAHEAGVIHRDLKPANVHVTPEGKVKVLDFGLAKPVHDARDEKSSTDSVHSTEAGRLLGTPTYMAPEQVRSRPIDKRVDIWAFGCVLYECLTGKRAFEGETLSDVLAAVLDREPNWTRLPGATPPHARQLLRRCLAKDPRERLRDAGEARIGLAHGESAGAPALSSGRRLSLAPLALTGIAGLLLGAVLAPRLLPRSSPAAARAARTVRSQLAPPRGARFQLIGDYGGAPQLSLDGTHVAFVGISDDGQSRLWIRALDELEARVVPGTEGAYLPFWSPDGRSLAFFADEQLCRIDLDSAAPLELCGVAQGKGGTWSPNGTLVYASNYNSVLFAIPAGGGTPRRLTELAPGHTTQRFPHFLPDGEHFFYFAASHDDPSVPQQGVWLGSLSGGAGTWLFASRSSAVYSAGQILTVRDSVLIAHPFDPSRSAVTGEPRPLADSVSLDPTTWLMMLGATPDGLLVYQPEADEPGAGLRWVDRGGEELEELPASGTHLRLRLSPDGRLLALESQLQPNSDVWIHDLERGTSWKLTIDPADDGSPTWSPDGQRVAFQSNRGDGDYRVYTKLASGAEAEELLFESSDPECKDVWPLDWSSDGRFLLLGSGGRFGNYEHGRVLSALDVEARGEPAVLLRSEAEMFAALSPDARWLAYSTVQGGEEEVYVTAFDATDVSAAVSAPPSVRRDPSPLLEGAPRWQISNSGGSRPRWSARGDELFYVRPDNVLMAVHLGAEARTLQVATPVALFQAPLHFRDNTYDVDSARDRFLLITQGVGTTTPLVLVEGSDLATRGGPGR